MTTYSTDGKVIVSHPDDLQRALASAGAPYYVYVLCLPPIAVSMVPFYVGIGQASRLFAHEEEARDSSLSSRKAEIIRSIWRQGGEPVRVIDDFFADPPWVREEELINRFGLEKDGTGILVNEQRYSPSSITDGVELRKYAPEGIALPHSFIRRDTLLLAGPRTPRNPLSVYGKICSVLERHPSVTGAELVELLLDTDFSDNNSAYTAGGAVSRPWLAKYIDGGFYKKNRFIQELNQDL